MKKFKLLELAYWYKEKKDTTPMFTYKWNVDTIAGIDLMASSDVVFTKQFLDDKDMPVEIKYLFAEMARDYLRQYEKVRDKIEIKVARKRINL